MAAGRIQLIFGWFIPPPRWRIPVILLAGALSGLGVTLLHISNAFSYLSDDPAACVNCHIMAPEYATWFHGSHGRGTVCNDCHVPHGNFFRKYWFKARDGLRHATLFTLRLEPQIIWAKEASAAVIQENCLRCHATRMSLVRAGGLTGHGRRQTGEQPCLFCHRSTPHGRVHSLASTPYARIPALPPVAPGWMRKNPVKK